MVPVLCIDNRNSSPSNVALLYPHDADVLMVEDVRIDQSDTPTTKMSQVRPRAAGSLRSPHELTSSSAGRTKAPVTAMPMAMSKLSGT